jgi:hypothetical protein
MAVPRSAQRAHSHRRAAAGDASSRPHWLAVRWQALVQRLRQGLRRVGAVLPAPLKRVLQPARTAAAVREPRSVALRQDFQELRQLLDRHALARRAMPHLDRVERTLAHVGSRGLFKLSVPVLEKAIVELEAVEQGVRLEELRSRLGSALDALRYRQARLERGRDVEISEATHSVFSELERTWTAPMPLSDSMAMPLSDSLRMPLSDSEPMPLSDSASMPLAEPVLRPNAAPRGARVAQR